MTCVAPFTTTLWANCRSGWWHVPGGSSESWLDAGLWKSYPKTERENKIAEQAEKISWRHIKDLTEQLLLAVQLDIRSLPEAFLADVEIVDPELGESVRMADYLESRASTGPEGLMLDEPTPGAIPMPPADHG